MTCLQNNTLTQANKNCLQLHTIEVKHSLVGHYIISTNVVNLNVIGEIN